VVARYVLGQGRPGKERQRGGKRGGGDLGFGIHDRFLAGMKAVAGEGNNPAVSRAGKNITAFLHLLSRLREPGRYASYGETFQM
jgi:hypothetical protein